MMNKKILAAAVAATFAFNANAIDMDLATEAGAKVASEATGTVTLGKFTILNDSGTLNFTVKAGFTIAVNTKKYVRIDLTNATFGAIPALTATNFLAPGVIQTGGAVDDAFVVFEITAHGTNPVAAADIITLAAASYKVSATAASSAQYALYDTALDAINQAPNATFKVADAPLTTVASVSSGKITATPVAGIGAVTATSASGFKKFAVEGNTTATVANLGSVDAALILTAGTGALAADGQAVAAVDLIPATTQVITFAGDFSYGTWSANTNTDCTTGASVVTTTLNTDKTQLVSAAVNPHVPVFLCQLVDGTKVIEKNSYTATLGTTLQSGTTGSVVYDTTSIAVPYLTTYSDYNQRIYLINSSSVDANYTVSFTSEAGVTATAGTAATGTVPAKSMLAVKATDIVTLAGKTRTTAVIEVETADANISATTQTVNLSDGSTDTIVLNN